MATTTEPSQAQLAKQNTIIQLLRRRGQASRLAMAQAVKISNSRICGLVDELLEDRLLIEQKPEGRTDRRGRSGVEVGLERLTFLSSCF